jgi:hypothetical protein
MFSNTQIKTRKLFKEHLGTAHYLLYRGRLRRNSTVIIFFRCPPLKTRKIFKAPPPNRQNKNINFGPPPSPPLDFYLYLEKQKL